MTDELVRPERLQRFLADYAYVSALNADLMRRVYRAEAPHFNPLRNLGIGEVQLSRVLSDLLDPAGTHGQGIRFLDEFLKTDGLPGWVRSLESGGTTVRTEAATYLIGNARRRIDILLRFADGATIGIENKFGAGEQIGQVSDYLDHLDLVSGDAHSLLIFLTPTGESPDSVDRPAWDARKQQGMAVELSYKDHVLPWLKRCREGAQAASVKAFLGQLQGYIQRELGMDENSPSQEVVANFVTRDPELLELALELMWARESVITAVVEEFFMALGREVETELGQPWTFTIDEELAGRYQGASLERTDRKDPARVRIESQSAGFNNIIIGVRNYEEDPGEAGSLYRELRPHLPRHGKQSAWWPWYESPHGEDSFANRSLLKQMLLESREGEGEMLDRWAQRLTKLASKLEEVLGP